MFLIGGFCLGIFGFGNGRVFTSEEEEGLISGNMGSGSGRCGSGSGNGKVNGLGPSLVDSTSCRFDIESSSSLRIGESVVEFIRDIAGAGAGAGELADGECDVGGESSAGGGSGAGGGAS